MLTLSRYILEALSSEAKKFFNNIFSNQEQLLKNDNVEHIKVVKEKLKKPKKPLRLLDLDDSSLLKNLGDKQLGLPLVSLILKQQKKFLADGDKSFSEANINPYFYVNDKGKVYLVGDIVFDEHIQYIDGYVHLISIETSPAIENSQEILKSMINDFETECGQTTINNNKILGITAKPIIPLLKTNLAHCGFSKSKDNTNLFIYKF